jgi:TPR repeat protein
MTSSLSRRVVELLAIFCLCARVASAQSAVTSPIPQPSQNPSYDALVRLGFDWLREGDAIKAYAAAMSAAELTPARFQAYALGAMACYTRGDSATARALIERAIAYAPAAQKRDLQRLKADIGADAARKLDAIRLVVVEADAAKNRDQRVPLLRQLMELTATYVEQYQVEPEIWLLRAAAALELDYPSIGWSAGQQLLRSPLGASSDPKVRSLLAQLERRGWLGATLPRRGEQGTKEQIIAAARRGDAEAQVTVAVESGLGNNDDVRAWLLLAAKQGNPAAFADLSLLAMMRGFREGPESDGPVEEVRWYRLASRHGVADAMRTVGLSYKAGVGLPLDKAEALRWLAESAEYGNTWATVDLAEILATDPEARYRNGPMALRLVEGVLAGAAASGRDDMSRHPAVLQVAAAAHAENGHWPEAIALQEQALALAKTSGLYANNPATFDGRLELYKDDQPYRIDSRK